MDEIAAPGILAYKAGECFVNLVSLINEIPAGRDINSTTIENLLQQYAMSLSLLPRFTTDIWLGIDFSFNLFLYFLDSGSIGVYISTCSIARSQWGRRW